MRIRRLDATWPPRRHTCAAELVPISAVPEPSTDVTIVGFPQIESWAPVAWPDAPMVLPEPYGPWNGPPPKNWPAVSVSSRIASQSVVLMTMKSGSIRADPRCPFIALNSCTALFPAAVPPEYTLMPRVAPMIPTRSFVPVPRTIWRSSSILTNRLRRPLMYDWTAGASSNISSEIGSSVAIFLTGSSVSVNPSVDCGFVAVSATPAAPEVAVPSTT